MLNSNLKKMCYLSGMSFNEVHTSYLQALKEAKSLGIDEDENKVISILEAILEINEFNNSNTSKQITNKYLKSGKDFNSFLEELTSSSIPQSSRPEPDIDLPFKTTKEEVDDDEEDIYNHKLDSNVDNIENIVNDKDVDHL